ncbi:hypothetical protein FB45DRAFT_1086110, partial [Roridomyces roridus]
RGKTKEAIPYLVKAVQDPENLNNCVALSDELPPEVRIDFLKRTEPRAHVQSVVSPDCFELTSAYGAPDFWGIIWTRPYMRLLGALAQTYIKIQNEAVERGCVRPTIEMLRLCESDNMGRRSWMGPILLHAGSPADALHFLRAWIEADGVPPHAGIDFASANLDVDRAPMPPSVLKRVSKWNNLQMVHSAALAAFTLDCNSELARQYLHIAVSSNPAVMIKVLGKFKERVDGDIHPTRTSNGVEDTRDHLWLAQDLWTKPAVWDWISNDPVVKDAVLCTCSEPSCGRKEERIGQWQKCSGCKLVWYCSRTCQKMHWPEHKEPCKE